MRFSCARCGQRYSSVDEPRTGFEYRVPCVACGAVVVLRGADFPALPTAAPGPALAARRGAVSDATGEEPLGLALGPLVLQERAALQRGSAPSASSRAAASGSSRWSRIAAGGGVALATAGAAFLLLFRSPRSACHTQRSSPLAAAPRPTPSFSTRVPCRRT